MRPRRGGHPKGETQTGMKKKGKIQVENRGRIKLRQHAEQGLYACVPQRFVAELEDWLTFRGVLLRVSRGDQALDCSKDECALIFPPGVHPAWVRDELELASFDVRLGEDVTLPESEYPPAVAQLLQLGDPGETEVDYEALGITEEHVAALVHLAVDEELYALPLTDRRYWALPHAWRALGQLRAAEAAKTLVDLLWRVGACDDEWVAGEVPDTLAEIGEPSLAPLMAYFDEEPEDEHGLEVAAEVIGRIGRDKPACRDFCVRGLTERLLHFDAYATSVNASVICALVDLKAVESLAVIEAAFEAGAVDLLWMGDVEDVRIALGVQAARVRLRDSCEEREWDGARAVAEDVLALGPHEDGAFEDEGTLDPYIAPLAVGRNDPCPCGSGKKYKKCCWRG